MCYDFKAQLYAQLKRAYYNRDKVAVELIKDRLQKLGAKDWYHAMGMQHPAILIYTKENPTDPILARWGFIRETLDKSKIAEVSRQVWSLNTVGESMFETWTYRESAKNKRCLVCVDGFFEHYHFNGRSFPHYIHTEDNEPMTLAGLWSEWTNELTGEVLRTFSIVTSAPNELMSKLHNNPTAPNGPRMPLILPEESIEDWLNIDAKTKAEQKRIIDLIKPYTDKELKAYTCGQLRGKRALGNVSFVTNKTTYPELGPEFNPHRDDGEQMTLFF